MPVTQTQTTIVILVKYSPIEHDSIDEEKKPIWMMIEGTDHQEHMLRTTHMQTFIHKLLLDEHEELLVKSMLLNKIQNSIIKLLSESVK